MNDEPELLWLTDLIECCVCTHQWLAVFLSSDDTEAMECPLCGAKNSTIVEAEPYSEYEKEEWE